MSHGACEDRASRAGTSLSPVPCPLFLVPCPQLGGVRACPLLLPPTVLHHSHCAKAQPCKRTAGTAATEHLSIHSLVECFTFPTWANNARSHRAPRKPLPHLTLPPPPCCKAGVQNVAEPAAGRWEHEGVPAARQLSLNLLLVTRCQSETRLVNQSRGKQEGSLVN